MSYPKFKNKKPETEEDQLTAEFLSCIDTEGVTSGRVPMGALGARIYEDGGDERFEEVRTSETYTISRESRFITIDKAEGALEGIETGHIYLLGASQEEAMAFTKAAPNLKSCSVIDIAAPEAKKVAQAVENTTSVHTQAHIMDYSKTLLPETNAEASVVLYPSSNVGNTRGFYGGSPENNPYLLDQFTKLRARADHLVVVYDTERNPQNLTRIYGGEKVEDFVKGVFETAKTRLELDGLNLNALRLDSFWHEPSSAEIHSVISDEDMPLKLNGEELMIRDQQRMFPVHSYKFTPEQMEACLFKTRWLLRSTQANDSTIVMQTYDAF